MIRKSPGEFANSTWKRLDFQLIAVSSFMCLSALLSLVGTHDCHIWRQHHWWFLESCTFCTKFNYVLRNFADREWKHLYGDFGRYTLAADVTTIRLMYFTYLAIKMETRYCDLCACIPANVPEAVSMLCLMNLLLRVNFSKN